MNKLGCTPTAAWRRRARIIVLAALVLACALLGSCTGALGDTGSGSSSTGGFVWDQTNWDAASWG